MSRTAICIAAALTAALAAGAMAGCSSQPASSASASASSTSTEASVSAEASSAAAEQSQDELIAELKAAVANAPAFKSVTLTEEDESVFEAEAADASAPAEASDASASAEASASAAASDESAEATTTTIVTNSVYKFDESGDKLKTSMTSKMEDMEIQYYTDGDDAVLVTDESSYSGTVKQFDMTSGKGFQAYFADSIGDLSTLADCAANIEKTEADGLTFYAVTLDPEKYIASDEVLSMMKDYGDPLKEASLSVGFDANGNIVSADLGTNYEKGHAMLKHLVMSDFDSTVVDPLPAAEKTYEDMEAAVQAKVDAIANELGSIEDSEDAASSSAAAEAK